MAVTQYCLALVLTVALIIPLLLWAVRSITAPWRALATRYPGPSGKYPQEVSYVTARFWGTLLPFPMTRCIRIRGDERELAFSVIGLDFRLAKLPEIVVPRSAVKECAPCDFLLHRQKMAFEGAPTKMVIYGRGAEFIRNWWNTRVS